MRERGHMNKWSFLKDMIHGADVIIEIVDARDVQGTRLPIAEKWAGSKRLLMVANKIDLLKPGTMLPKLQNKGIYLSAKKFSEQDRWDFLNGIMARTSVRPVKAILVGYPNVGKSSLINMVVRRSVTRVSAVAGTTKNIQWVKVNDELMISDYRGLFPNKETPEMLVRKGAINVAGNEEKFAYQFLERVSKKPHLVEWLEEKYGIKLKDAKNPEEILEKIAKRRGWCLKGGEPNIEEAARSIVRTMKDAPEI